MASPPWSGDPVFNRRFRLNALRLEEHRKDEKMRRVVEAGMRLGKFDIESAAAMMRQAGVPLHVSVRVLAGRGSLFRWSKKK